MLDIAYFNASEDDFPGLLEDPVGMPLAQLIRPSLVSLGFDTTVPVPYWDGVALYASSNGRRFRLELTPYFEKQPPEWSVQVVPHGILAKLFGAEIMRSVCAAVDSALQATPTISQIRWFQLSNGVLGEGQPTFSL